jgi:hypothetical protein
LTHGITRKRLLLVSDASLLSLKKIAAICKYIEAVSDEYRCVLSRINAQYIPSYVFSGITEQRGGRWVICTIPLPVP